ncbi:hypothetical protein HZA33_02735 [Candidatus Pacearchaeota archaeon]|nr:hypothetical protein [Candidatus Pacearchaeota archaeon]
MVKKLDWAALRGGIAANSKDEEGASERRRWEAAGKAEGYARESERKQRVKKIGELRKAIERGRKLEGLGLRYAATGAEVLAYGDRILRYAKGWVGNYQEAFRAYAVALLEKDAEFESVEKRVYRLLKDMAKYGLGKRTEEILHLWDREKSRYEQKKGK